MRRREIKNSTKDYTTSQIQSQNLNPGLWSPSIWVRTTCISFISKEPNTGLTWVNTQWIIHFTLKLGTTNVHQEHAQTQQHRADTEWKDTKEEIRMKSPSLRVTIHLPVKVKGLNPLFSHSSKLSPPFTSPPHHRHALRLALSTLAYCHKLYTLH